MFSDDHDLNWLHGRRRTPLIERNDLWERPWRTNRRLRRLIFDAAFGVFLPLTCFVLDPGIVGYYLEDNGLLAISDLAGIQIMLMAFWLFVPGHRGITAGYVSGALRVGAAVALVFGVALLPSVSFSIVFIFMTPWWIVYFLLGLSPFLTCFTFLRNARDSYVVSELSIGQKKTRLQMLVGAGVLLIYIALIAFFSDLHLFHIGTRWVQEAIGYDIYW